MILLLEVMLVLAVFIIWVISGLVLANELWKYQEESQPLLLMIL